MVKTKTEQAIIDALEAVAPQHDVDIVDVELVGATKAPCVRVRIEGAEGQSLSLNDVTANTKWVGDVIEELDPISSSYTLEVSSPGMARPLRRPSDFARFVGEDCELTSTATEGRRKYTGKIAAATETNVTLELEDGESVTLDFCDVKKCKLKPTYDLSPRRKESKMAASDMMSALMELCQEKHIDQLYLIDRLEQSLAKSYAEILHLEWGAKVTIDRTTGKIYVYRLEPIDDSMDEEGNFTEFEEIDVTPKNTSRIAAQHAKAEINAIVRNSAREQIYEEFSGRIGDLISGTVLQSTPDFTIVKIREGVEAELPHFDQRRYENERNERPMGERYLHNQHIKAVIIDVRDPNSNLQPVRGEHSRPPIVISRTHPELMRRLFEQEVPEIYEGTVQIKSIAREPGQRSKVAVHSLDDRLDPVGACVGPKGSRVRAVVGELRGERVDVILWDADPAVYVANALSPAKVTRVLIDEEKAYAGVIVPDDQLSLAIGKEGQNARLAARLTGWHIDIKSETLAADILKNVPVHEEPAADLIGDEEDEDVRRCEFVSEDGIQCRNQARPGSRFCGVHDTDAFDDAEDLI